MSRSLVVSGRVFWALSGALGLLVGLALVWPALGPDQILGVPDNDTYGSLWLRWQLGQAVLGAEQPWWTHLQAWPLGLDLLRTTGLNILDLLVSLPLTLVLGAAPAHDAWALLLLASNFWALCLLGRRWQGPGWTGALALWVVALVVGAGPFVLHELAAGRPTQAWLAPLALALHLAGDLGRGRSRAVHLALGLALVGWTYWYAAIWGGALVLAVGLAVHPQRALVAGGMALLLVAPGLAWILLGDAPVQLADQATPLLVLGVDGRAVLSGALLPGAGHRVQGAQVVGMGTLGGAVAAVAWARQRQGAAVLIAGVLCVGFALGDRPFGWFESPLYALWLGLGGVARRLWYPVRAVGAAELAGALALAWGLGRLGCRGPRGVLLLLPLLLAGWVACGATRALPTSPLPASGPALQWLSLAPPGAVVVLPSGDRETWLLDQVVHERPIQAVMGGSNPALAWPALTRWRADHPALTALEDLAQTRSAIPPTRQALQDLGQAGFGYVLLDLGAADRHSAVSGRDVLAACTRLLGAPAVVDSAHAVWVLPPAS